MTETKLNGLTIHNIDSKETYDALVAAGLIGENDLALVKEDASAFNLGITGASVGDIVKVKAVDASGKPTAWEAAGYTLLSESTGISEAVAMFEFTGLIGYNDFVLVANMPKASGSAKYILYINNRQVSVSLGNYFLHPNSRKNVILGVACNFIDKHYMTYGASQEQNLPYNQDSFGVNFGQTLLSDNESIESLKIASDKSDVLIPAQTSYKFYGRYINA